MGVYTKNAPEGRFLSGICDKLDKRIHKIHVVASIEALHGYVEKPLPQLQLIPAGIIRCKKHNAVDTASGHIAPSIQDILNALGHLRRIADAISALAKRLRRRVGGKANNTSKRKKTTTERNK